MATKKYLEQQHKMDEATILFYKAKIKEIVSRSIDMNPHPSINAVKVSCCICGASAIFSPRTFSENSILPNDEKLDHSQIYRFEGGKLKKFECPLKYETEYKMDALFLLKSIKEDLRYELEEVK